MNIFNVFLGMFCILSSSNAQICNQNHPCTNSHWPANNLSISCVGDGVCDGSSFYCAGGDCLIETNGDLRNVNIDASYIGKGHKFELKCNNKCENINIICSDILGSTCKCTACNRQVTMKCFHGKSYCSSGGAKILPIWKENNIWCKTPETNSMMMPFGMMPAYCPSAEYMAVSCRSLYVSPSNTYPYGPSDKCVAFNFSYHSDYYKENLYYIELVSCGKMINESTMEIDYVTPTCVEYLFGDPMLPSAKPLCKNQTITKYIVVTRSIEQYSNSTTNSLPWYSLEFLQQYLFFFILCVGLIVFLCVLRRCCFGKIECKCCKSYCSYCEWDMCFSRYYGKNRMRRSL